MNTKQLNTIPLLEEFLHGNQMVAMVILGNKHEKYRFIQSTLVRLCYYTLSKRDKGVVRQYLIKVTGYSKPQLTRLIRAYVKTGTILWKPAKNNGFSKKYSDKDLQLLVKMDNRHDRPCGAAIKKYCERAVELFGEQEYSTLAGISISHLYNLRSSDGYQKKYRHFTKTQARKIPIGERRKPQANGQPGYIRIDTVHQGDRGKEKGVYHINAVDEETQMEFICAVEKITEEFMVPAIEKMLGYFPFKIQGFHSDNGSEYINYPMASLLEQLSIDFTKSRSRHSNDNGLAESKNCSIVRKQFGYEHIPQVWASHLNAFNDDYLLAHINYHRPCFYPESKVDKKGKERKTYPYKGMMTPYEKLKSLKNAQQYLKPGVSFEKLDEIALQMSDNTSAELLQQARNQLFKQIFEQDRHRA